MQLTNEGVFDGTHQGSLHITTLRGSLILLEGSDPLLTLPYFAHCIQHFGDISFAAAGTGLQNSLPSQHRCMDEQQLVTCIPHLSRRVGQMDSN